MDATPIRPEDHAAALEVVAPPEQAVPWVFASPHSGRNYSDEFVRASALDALTLRRSEDSYVDELFGAAPGLGAPLIKALFPRAYLDANREPYELDPRMFADPLPDYANTRSPRVSAGLGTIARVVAGGAEIYAGKLSFAEAEVRINALYRPYHSALQRLVDATRDRFGLCVLIDCHSMPSIGGPMERDPGVARLDFVLGDCFGTSCAPAVVEAAEELLRGQGYRVARNTPYAGGFTTSHYGRPRDGLHALQIEVNRRLYMDERTQERGPGFARIAADIGALVAALVALPAARIGRP